MFELVTTAQNQSVENRPVVNWDELNKHVVDVAKTQDKPRSIPGIISGIVDLGEQELEDAEQPFVGDAAAEAKAIEEKPATYFKDGFDEKGNPVRLKCWPQKPVQQVMVTVDFPQVIVDKGRFFGKTNPQPLRMSLNGEFTLSDRTKVVSRPYNIREVKHDDGTWAFAKNNGLHKLAAACELLDAKGYFTKGRIGELLGKVAQFQFQVFMKAGKNGGEFFTENVKLVGLVPEGVNIPEVPEGILYGINLHPRSGANDPEAVKQLRLAAKNTIKRALNYEGSTLKAEIEANEGGSGQRATAPTQTQVAPVAPSTPAPQEDDGFDDDVPF
ncbi:hypothetical protein D3C79_569440 [compost metagenome]